MTQRVPAVRSVSASLLLCACVLATAVSVSGCRKREPDMPPVATPNVTFSKERVAIGSPVKVTYRFQVAANAKFDGDYWVFVHVLNPQGEMLWNDDHLPSRPTSQWMPGQTIEYTGRSSCRTIRMLARPTSGSDCTPSRRQAAGAGGPRSVAARVRGRQDRTAAAVGERFLIYKEGWHPAEIASENPMSEWQWTQKRATFSFRNPKKDANSISKCDARRPLHAAAAGHRPGRRQRLTSFPADVKEKTLLVDSITAAHSGTARWWK